MSESKVGFREGLWSMGMEGGYGSTANEEDDDEEGDARTS